jgi:hypothetical protein
MLLLCMQRNGLLQVLINSLPHLAERAIVGRTPWLALSSAEQVFGAVGSMLRQYCGFLEDAALADLAKAASAGQVAGTLSPDAAALLGNRPAPEATSKAAVSESVLEDTDKVAATFGCFGPNAAVSTTFERTTVRFPLHLSQCFLCPPPF